MNTVLALGTETVLLNCIKQELKSVRPQTQNISNKNLSKTNTLNTLISEKSNHLWTKCQCLNEVYTINIVFALPQDTMWLGKALH